MSQDATVCAGSSAGYNWIMFLFLTSAGLMVLRCTRHQLLLQESSLQLYQPPAQGTEDAGAKVRWRLVLPIIKQATFQHKMPQRIAWFDKDSPSYSDLLMPS